MVEFDVTIFISRLVVVDVIVTVVAVVVVVLIRIFPLALFVFNQAITITLPSSKKKQQKKVNAVYYIAVYRYPNQNA